MKFKTFQELTKVQCSSVEPKPNNYSLHMKSVDSEKGNYWWTKEVIQKFFQLQKLNAQQCVSTSVESPPLNTTTFVLQVAKNCCSLPQIIKQTDTMTQLREFSCFITLLWRARYSAQMETLLWFMLTKAGGFPSDHTKWMSCVFVSEKNAYTRSVWYGMRMFGEKPSLKTSNYVHVNAIQSTAGPLNTP